MAHNLLSGALDRIDHLAHARRSEPSTENDELLIKLRRDAAAHIVLGDAIGLPQPPADDPFAGTTGLPEVDAPRLTAAHIASGLLRHGALLVRGAVGNKHLDMLTVYLDERETAARAHATDTDEVRTERLKESIREAVRKGLPRLMCSPSAACDVIEMYKEVGVARPIAEYLGARPVLMSERIRLTRQRAGPGLAWHQDASFYGGAFYAVNVWLAVSPCGAGAPGLNVIPRRFDSVCGMEEGESFPLPVEYGERFTPERIRELAGEVPICDPDFAPGDALLFDEMTMHRTAPKEWKHTYRDSAVTWFLAPSRIPDGVTPLVF